MSVLLIIWKVVRPILVFGITLPIWVFLVAGAWLYFDRTSAVRAAVNRATTELVAGAQLDALQAQVAEERRLRAWTDGHADEARRIADAERAARADLEEQLKESDADRKAKQDELDAIAAGSRDGVGRVGKPQLDRLRNR
ncbi:hypothetical protein [Mesorhizobium sp. 128a]